MPRVYAQSICPEHMPRVYAESGRHLWVTLAAGAYVKGKNANESMLTNANTITSIWKSISLLQ